LPQHFAALDGVHKGVFNQRHGWFQTRQADGDARYKQNGEPGQEQTPPAAFPGLIWAGDVHDSIADGGMRIAE
jgi:hypothetical protein